MENPHLVQAEEWFWKRDNERKTEDAAGPSKVIKLESDDESEDNGESEESSTSERRPWHWNAVDTQADDDDDE